MRKEGHFSYPAIGDFLKKDHSTIMHSANKIKDALKRDETVLREMNAVRDYLYRRSS
jgi:chromosomal replication initiation ATPase DnaA